MKQNSAYNIVLDYHRAWTSGNADLAMSYVSADITCRSPGADFQGKDAYRSFITGFAPTLIGIGEIAEFVDGDRVALFYYPQTAATSTAPAPKLFTITDGKIVESILVFDRLSYALPTRN